MKLQIQYFSFNLFLFVYKFKSLNAQFGPGRDPNGGQVISNLVTSSLLEELERTFGDMRREENEHPTSSHHTKMQHLSLGINEIKKSINSTEKISLSDPFKSWNIAKNSRSGCRSTSTGQMTSCDSVLPINLNYGCWCHADNMDIFKGTGEFMDPFDKACKMYKQCLRCVRHDSREEGEVCDPATQTYTTDNSKSSEGVYVECSESNPSNCASHTCCCDLEYVRTVLKLFIVDGIQLNDNYRHEVFDHENSCPGVGPGPSVKACCGDYPHRRTYNTLKRDCCHENSIFNPVDTICCEDGETAKTLDDCNSIVKKRKKRRAERKRLTRSTLGYYNM